MDDRRPNSPSELDPDRGEATTVARGTVGVSRPGELDYDAELHRHNEIFRPACAVGPREHVLDIGCGTGQTTRQAARLAVAGDALGVDLGDPGTAFANIGRALRPAGRLVMLVSQAREHYEWTLAIDRALDASSASSANKAADRGAPDAFSLADPTTTTALLHAAGFADVTCTDVRQPVYYGPDPDTALAWVRRFGTTQRALRQLDPPAAERTLDRLRATMTEHLGADGVWFDSGAWLVTARRRAGDQPPTSRRATDPP
ncbi:MAG TPA: class I SAM-dependent methyltransferase [Pseudonocardia sp.]|jgi:SAM-dependent methyltransferase|nr:class I SAM-dependent methyltransferase [Pseudonocardia sp.]